MSSPGTASEYGCFPSPSLRALAPWLSPPRLPAARAAPGASLLLLHPLVVCCAARKAFFLLLLFVAKASAFANPAGPSPRQPLLGTGFDKRAPRSLGCPLLASPSKQPGFGALLAPGSATTCPALSEGTARRSSNPQGTKHQGKLGTCPLLPAPPARGDLSQKGGSALGTEQALPGGAGSEPCGLGAESFQAPKSSGR